MSKEQVNPEMFDKLAKLEGEDFKRAMVECLKLIYSLHFRGERQHNENIEQVSNAMKSLQESVTDAMSRLEAFNKQYKEIMDAVKGDNTVH